MAFMTNSIAALAGPPALGAIITATGEYWQGNCEGSFQSLYLLIITFRLAASYTAAIVAASCSLVSFAIMIWVRRLLSGTRGTWKV